MRLSRSDLHRFAQDRDGATAVEFAIIGAPFFFLLLTILQMGIFYMTQSSLNTGVIKTADALRRSFTTGTSLTIPTAITVKSDVASNSGGLVRNDSKLAVDVRQVANLGGGSVPITDGTTDFGTNKSALVLRAQVQAFSFIPGVSRLLVARSSAILRRQGT